MIVGTRLRGARRSSILFVRTSLLLLTFLAAVMLS